MDFSSLLKNTNAYKILAGDEKKGTLSHAILIVSEDSYTLKDFAVFFAKLIICGENGENTRALRLIEKNEYPDAVFYPTDKKIKTADIDELVEKSFLKPLECDKKLFVLVGAQDMNAQAQNKLLKTLEEPPENTYILLMATSVYPLLATVMSRVKRIDVPPFTDDEIFTALKDGRTDEEKLKAAIRLSGGKVGEAISRYDDGGAGIPEKAAYKILTELKSSRQVALLSATLDKISLSDFVSAAFSLIAETLRYKSGLKKNVENNVKTLAGEYSFGALSFIEEKLKEAEKAIYFNGNRAAVTDAILFGILEGRHKWSE